MYFYFPELGVDKTEQAAMDRAFERTATAYIRRVSAFADEDVDWVTRHGSRAAADSAVLRAFKSTGLASSLELMERSKICEVPEGFRVWELYAVSVELTFRRIQQVDPLARGIDFVGEYRKPFRRP
jgi:hypothetical protein